MTNLKPSTVSYQPFEGHAILQDGLLAVRRPGGEVQQALADSLFGVADIFRAKAERTAALRGQEAGLAAGRAADPSVEVRGGDRGPGVATQSDGGTAENSRAAIPAGSGVVHDAIGKASARYGVSVSTMLRIAKIESGLNPNAKNNSSSAGGLFQQIDDNAAQYGVANRFDPYQSADGAARFMRDNIAYLTKKLNRAPTAGEVYLAHQQGGGGAVNLLANADKPAVDVIGRERLLKNGGNVNMTAGQFAAMWTSKLDGNDPARPAPPIDAGMGPMPIVDMGSNDYQVTPGERSPLQISGHDGGIALTGRDTIFGRSFDKAATETYSARLQDQMLTAADDITQKFADDPAGMREAFDQLKEAQLSHDVPDAIRADYEDAHSRVARDALRKSQAAYEKKLKTEDAQKWADGSAKFEEGVSRAQVGLEAGSADSMAVMAGQAQRLKQHWREGVAQGFITPQQAQEAAQKLDGDVQAQWYISQAKGQRPDQIEGMRTQLQADYAAGKLNGVDSRAWDKIDTSLKRAAIDAQQEINGNMTKLGKQADSILTRAALGYQIAPGDVEAMRGAAKLVEGGDQIVSGALSILDIAKELRNGPIDDAEKKLNELKTSIGDTPTDAQVEIIGKGEKMLDTARRALSEDLLGYAERTGVVKDAGDLSTVKTADDMGNLIKQRIGAAEIAAKHFGVAERFFRPGEVKALQDLVMENPDKGAAMAGSLLQASGDKMGAVLQEFGKGAPVLAGAGAIMADGGDAVAARDAIAGAGKDAEGNAYSGKGWQQRKVLARKTTGIALRFNPDDEGRVMATAERIARKRIDDAGVEVDSQEATDIMDQAVNEAAGAVYDGKVKWGGFSEYDPGFWKEAQQVLVPNNMRADRFSDVIDAVKPEDLPVRPQGGLQRLQELWPVMTPQGYVFVDTDADGALSVLPGEDGKPFHLNLGGMARLLGPRVPGAFKGY